MKIATFICPLEELTPNTGGCALVNGQQVAVFRIVDQDGENLYAISNHDPFSRANVLSRGMVGSTKGQPFVASPIYKQRFNLLTGECLDDPQVQLETWSVHCQDGKIYIEPRPRQIAA